MFSQALGKSLPDSACIDFGFLFNPAGQVECVENGISMRSPLSGSWVDTDNVLEIRVVGNVVTYIVRGTTIHTSSKMPTFPLLVDTALNTPGDQLSEVAISC